MTGGDRGARRVRRSTRQSALCRLLPLPFLPWSLLSLPLFLTCYHRDAVFTCSGPSHPSLSG